MTIEKLRSYSNNLGDEVDQRYCDSISLLIDHYDREHQDYIRWGAGYPDTVYSFVQIDGRVLNYIVSNFNVRFWEEGFKIIW